MRLNTAGGLDRAMQPNLLPYVDDRYLDLDIGSEGGNDVHVAARMPCGNTTWSTGSYGQIDRERLELRATQLTGHLHNSQMVSSGPSHTFHM